MHNKLTFKNPSTLNILLSFDDKITNYQFVREKTKKIKHTTITGYNIFQQLYRRTTLKIELSNLKRSELINLDNIVDSHNWVLSVEFNKQKTFLDNSPKCNIEIIKEKDDDYKHLNFENDDLVDVLLLIEPLKPNI